MRRLLSFAFVFLFTSVSLHASCGSSSCPLDLNALNAPVAGQLGFDLSFQYINQTQPMIGTRSAFYGELPSDHTEIHTKNAITTASLAYALSRDLQLSVALPYVSRSHLHVENGAPQSWNLNAIGDLVLQSRYRVLANQRATAGGLWVIAGIKFPTGPHDLRNSQGDMAEVTLQPGTGTTDGIVGLSWQSGIRAHSRVNDFMGNIAVVPFFATATYQFRHGDVNGYRVGNDFQVSTGAAYPLAHDLFALLQINGRVRAQDRIVSGEFDPDVLFTGGTYVYATPGFRVDTHSIGVYALVQIPLYQRVNGLQLTSRANVVAGVQHRFR